MNNKPETTEQIINLPQGGGSIKGIGESFSPDQRTGTFFLLGAQTLYLKGIAFSLDLTELKTEHLTK